MTGAIIKINKLALLGKMGFASSLCTLVQWESSETSYSNILIPRFPCKIYNYYKFHNLFHGATFKSNDAQFVKYINTT
jgi:hypothetical protein